MNDAPVMARLQPLRLGCWTLLRRLSVGGMSEVFAALDDRHPPRRAALKRLLPHLAEDPEIVAQFFAEAHILRCIDHRQVTAVLDAGEASGVPWIAMAFVEGIDLHAFSALATRLPTPPEIAAFAFLAASALAAVHAARDGAGQPLHVVHRDVSPHNIMLNSNGIVQLIDFGIARFDGAEHKTRTGVIKGKHAYMSPEQVHNRTIDGRSDLFALGVVLWELATGQRLFHRDSLLETLEQVTTAIVAHPSSLRPDLPRDLGDAISACLGREPADRPESADMATEMFATACMGLISPNLRRDALLPASHTTIAAMIASEINVIQAISARNACFAQAPLQDFSRDDRATPSLQSAIAPSDRPGIETTHIGVDGLEGLIAAHLAQLRGPGATSGPETSVDTVPSLPPTRVPTHE